MEIVDPQPPSGQQFILRYYLREVFARASFSGDPWTSCMAALRKRLAELGEQRLTMLITSDFSRSWAIYLSEGLDEVQAYHGRSLPGPRYSVEDDEEDVTKGTLSPFLLRAMKK